MTAEQLMRGPSWTMVQACHLSCATLMGKAAKIQNENQKFSKGFQGMTLLPEGGEFFHFFKPRGNSNLYNGWSMMDNLKTQITIKGEQSHKHKL